jgi:hypothetical protein
MRQKSTYVKQSRKTSSNGDIGWDAMIRDARKRIADLHYSIEVFEKRKLAGESCPVEMQLGGQNLRHYGVAGGVLVFKTLPGSSAERGRILA